MSKDSERRALMRSIWTHNIEHHWTRVQAHESPWLIEHYPKPEKNENDPYGLPAIRHVSIEFENFRTVEEVPLWERYQRFRQSVHVLYRAASLARERAMSWRGFNVGAAALCFKPNMSHENAWRVFAGMNVKHAPNMRPVCAEPIAIGSAYAEKFGLMIGMVVVGALREEDEGIIDTLHPCRDCRWFMDGHPIVDEHSIILTAMPEELGGFKKREVRTLRQLLSTHRRISGDDFS